MRVGTLSSVLATTAGLLSATNGLNILISNDDGFGTSHIRELYKAMKAYGHNVWIVASATNQSGMGGTVVYTNNRTLAQDSEFGIVKAGAPSVGPDPIDSHIWYYNGTPSACVQVALDHVLPLYANFSVPDLVLSGPNFGLNLGPFLYTLAGTLGATYTAIERGIPAIGISAGNSVQTPYFNVSSPTKAGLTDPATIIGRLSANLAQTLITQAAGGRVLPYGYGINVNIPTITSSVDATCINPPFVHTRLTGGAYSDKAVLNETTGLFSYGNVVSPGTNTCINGDCTLPGEQDLLNSGCFSSVSVFTVDYDAPDCNGAANVRGLLSSLVQTNGTGLVGGLNATSTVYGSNTTTSETTSKPTTTSSFVPNGAGAIAGSKVLALLVAGAGVALML